MLCLSCTYMAKRMEGEGKVHFLHHHQGSVRGVAFHPKDQYLFCSGAYDGKVNLYSAQTYEFLQSYAVTTVSLARNVNAVRFTSDGSKILATTTARRLAVIDVEKGDQVLSYDNCAFNGRDRAGLAVDASTPNMVVCSSVNGKGFTLFDLRIPVPLDFLHDIHGGVIRDVAFLHESWPWCKGQRTILSVGEDGLCKVSTLNGHIVHVADAGQAANTVVPTPENYGSAVDDGFASLITIGGDGILAYVPEAGTKEYLRDNKDSPIWKLRYTAHGSFLYSACDRGVIRRYRRCPDHHIYLGEVFRHKGDVEDMDISPYDEYLVTASKDRSVGIFKLGGPNHGSSEYGELT